MGIFPNYYSLGRTAIFFIFYFILKLCLYPAAFLYMKLEDEGAQIHFIKTYIFHFNGKQHLHPIASFQWKATQ